MDISSIKSWLGLCLLLCAVYGRKNVLFLIADDLRPELTCYEGADFPTPIHPPIHSPNMDALAGKSLLLKRAYVQHALCSPSRSSLLTGRRPDTTHIYDLIHYFRDLGGNFTTIPEFFKANGYKVAGMGKIFHHGNASGNDDPISWTEPYFHAKEYGLENKDRTWSAVPDNLLEHKPLVDYQIAQKAITTLRYFSKGGKYEGEPFFIAVGFHKPHLPFVSPKSFFQYYPETIVRSPDNQYAPDGMPEVAWGTYKELRLYGDIQRLNVSGAFNTTIPPDNVLALRRAYYAAISWMDSLIGVVIEEMRSLGFADNTVISFFGDHGWQLGEHAEWSKNTNFEIATHAPMMVHVPGLTDQGIVTEQLTEFVDLFPTLVEAAGLGTMPICPEDSSNVGLCREGDSLMPLIQNPQGPWKSAAFSQVIRKINNTSIMGYTIRTDRYRYTEWPKFNTAPEYKPDWNVSFGEELYDHKIDPDENKNRAHDPSYASIQAELSQKLRAGWRAARPNDNDIIVG